MPLPYRYIVAFPLTTCLSPALSYAQQNPWFPSEDAEQAQEAVAESPENTDKAPLNPYYVEGVEVSKNAESGEKAMEQAVAEGERLAFVRLLQTLGYADAEEIAARFDDGAVGAAVTEMDVSGERVGAKHYKATFAFKFRESAVRAMLDGAGVADVAPTVNQWQNDYSDYRQAPAQNAAPLGILPIFEDVTGILQWDGDNIWQRAWNGVAMATPGASTPPQAAPTLHPLFLEDIRNDILAPEDVDRIREGMASFVPAGNMIVTLGEFSQEPGDPQGTIIVRTARITPQFTPLNTQKFIPQPGERFEAFANRIARATFDGLRLSRGQASVYGQDVWGAPSEEEDAYVYDPNNARPAGTPHGYGSVCDDSPERNVTLTVPAYDLKEWVETENRIRASEGVVFVQPHNLTPGRMTISVVHRCGENLAQSLGRSGLYFDANNQAVTIAKQGY